MMTILREDRERSKHRGRIKANGYGHIAQDSGS